jgi:unsaturated rhamnogalacturonyl hydrolase
MKKTTHLYRKARYSLSIQLVLTLLCTSGFATCVARPVNGQINNDPSVWSKRVAGSTIHRWPRGRFGDASSAPRWNYQLGLLLKGMEAEWQVNGDQAAFDYIQQSMDMLVREDGSIPTYEPKAYSMDDILLGRQLLLLYRVTGQDKYLIAARSIRKQLDTQPRNASGGFWHTQSFPNQMLLDDMYMLAPFLAEYAVTFHEPKDLADIAQQLALLEKHTRDPRTGLLYQEWNEPRNEAWVNQATGTSASFWGRGLGWYVIALVDTIPFYSEHDPDRARLIAILTRTATGIVRHQNPKTGVWYEILDKPEAKGNYLESSASGMFTYALAKGVRLGYLPPAFAVNAEHAWQGLLATFVKVDSDEAVTITATVKGIDLGSAPSHDGSFQYYTSAPVIDNDPKGIGAFLLASSEMARLKAHSKIPVADQVQPAGH